MTTPAQNVNVNTQLPTHFDKWINGVPTTPLNSVAWVGSNVNIRPASGTSPIRPNGTRAPRAWTNRWFQGTPLYRALSWTQQAGANLIKYETPSQTAIDVLADRVFNSVGATWCRIASPTGFPFNVEAQARTNFLLEVAGGKMQLGATLGEMGQTIRMVGKLSEEMVRGAVGIASRYDLLKEDVARLLTGKKLRKMPPAEYLRWKKLAPAVISRWLEVQFGIRPLISDIEDSGAVLSAMIFEERKEAILSVRKGRRVIERVTGRLNGTIAPGWVYDQPWLVETSCHISGSYRMPITAERTYQELGLSNSASVAWELTQFSWMVDYVLGVGDWLESMTATQGLQWIEGSISRIQEISPAGRGQFLPTGAEIKFLKGFYPAKYEATGGRFERAVLPTSPYPSALPPVRSRLGLDQMANSLAALAVFAGGGRGLS